MYSIVKTFRVTIILFSRQLSDNNTTHFATLATTAQLIMSTEKYTNMIFVVDLVVGFVSRTSKNLVTIWNYIITVYKQLWKSTWCYTDWFAVWLNPQREISILKYWKILCITEYIQVCQLEKDGHETTSSVRVRDHQQD